MPQVPYRLLAALTITLTLGGCVTYPATPVVVERSYVRKATPVYSYSVITDPGHRYYDDALGVYVFYDRSDVFFRQGRYYRWHQDHWISANHWRGPWYPAPNLYISGNFNDRWQSRLRRHGQRYAGGHHYTPPRRHVDDDGYNRGDRHDVNAHRDDRREEGQDRRGQGQNRGRGGEHGSAGIAETKRRASQADNRSGDRGNERRNPGRNPSRDERAVKLADKPTGIRGPRAVPALERPATDRRTVGEKPKPTTQHGQPQLPRSAPNDRRNAAAKPASRQEREQPKSEQPKKKDKDKDKEKDKEKKSKSNADRRDQVRMVREPLSRQSK